MIVGPSFQHAEHEPTENPAGANAGHTVSVHQPNGERSRYITVTVITLTRRIRAHCISLAVALHSINPSRFPVEAPLKAENKEMASNIQEGSGTTGHHLMYDTVAGTSMIASRAEGPPRTALGCRTDFRGHGA